MNGYKDFDDSGLESLACHQKYNTHEWILQQCMQHQISENLKESLQERNAVLSNFASPLTILESIACSMLLISVLKTNS
jgi:hypothetical protein